MASFKLERGENLKDVVLTSGAFGTMSEVATVINLDPAAEAAKDKNDETLSLNGPSPLDVILYVSMEEDEALRDEAFLFCFLARKVDI